MADKALNVNVYQHEPFLKNFNKNQQTNLVKIADAVVQPMGLYSDTVKSLEAILEGAKIAIPNDPTNGGRTLVLLKTAGLIDLKPGMTGTTATVADITANSKGVKVVELEAAQLPRSLEDVDVACVPMNYAISGKLSPKKAGFLFRVARGAVRTDGDRCATGQRSGEERFDVCEGIPVARSEGFYQ